MSELLETQDGHAPDTEGIPTLDADLAARTRALQHLNDLVARLLRLDTAGAVYEAALDGVLALVGAARGGVAVTDDAHRVFRLVTHRGYSRATRRSIEELGYDAPLAHNLARITRDVVVLHVRDMADPSKSLLVTEAVPLAVLLPLLRRGQVTAVLSYVLEEDRPFDASARALLRTAATYVGAALERAQLYAENEDALRASETQRQLLETVLDGAPVGIAFYDTDLVVVNLNAAWARLSGVDFATARGQALLDLVPDTRRREPQLRQALAGQAVDLADVDFVTPGAERPRYYDIHYRPLRDAAGTVTGVLSTLVDVTPRYQLNEQKDQFIALASHELKTPLTAIKAYAQTTLRAIRDLGDPRLLRMARIIDEQSDRLNRLINDLLDISYMQTTQRALERELLDLGALVREVVANLQLTAPTFTLAADLPAEPIWVLGDAQRIEQVLTNLIQNALKYSDESNRVEIAVRLAEGEVITSVRDFGVGIPADQQEHIFERFFRASNVASRNYSGLGLGLFISQSIVTRHGGRIWLESQEGVGSTFYFALPTAAL